jgi:hypothetical protein
MHDAFWKSQNSSPTLNRLEVATKARPRHLRSLGKRSRSQDHHDAEELVEQINPSGAKAKSDLRRLLNIKDEAQYGVFHVSGTERRAALRQANALLDFAERIAES